jgi:hypothetical protein
MSIVLLFVIVSELYILTISYLPDEALLMTFGWLGSLCVCDEVEPEVSIFP